MKLGLRKRTGGKEGVSSQLSIFFLVDALVTEPDSLFALEVVRQRLHEKIQEARHQVTREASGLWGAVWFIRVVSVLCLEERCLAALCGVGSQLSQPLWGWWERLQLPLPPL